MKNVLKICRNELRTIFTDKGTILVMVVGVLMYALFYSLPFLGQILRDVPIAVVDMDNSSLSRELVRDLDSNEFLKVQGKLSNVNEAKNQFYANKIRAYVLIPQDFERDIFRGKKSNVALFEDSSYLLVYKQVATGVATTVGSLSAKLEVGKFMKKGLSRQQAITVKKAFDFVQIPLFNPASAYENYIYPLVLVLILQQTMLVGAGLLGGTLREKLINGDGKSKIEFCEFSDDPSEIVLGKALAYVSVYSLHSVFYFLVFPVIFVYHMSYNYLALFLILFPFLLSVAFLAQALVYFYTERETSLLMLVVTSLPLVFLPGFVWPKESIPMWLNVFAKFIPAAPAIDGLTRVNQMGASFWQVQNDFWMLLGLCLFYFLIARAVVKRLCK